MLSDPANMAVYLVPKFLAKTWLFVLVMRRGVLQLVRRLRQNDPVHYCKRRSTWPTPARKECLTSSKNSLRHGKARTSCLRGGAFRLSLEPIMKPHRGTL